ncbi:hypothetical protein RRG08_036219 [Elysia crispata]|uniref:Uncharacterized protein n=1 Tax=Elysia crispata TaxID=231223 RepID=A0AAE0XEP4_9GAST|nr:hypothetical protein RRG08_036219 [Elysia crispata]
MDSIKIKKAAKNTKKYLYLEHPPLSSPLASTCPAAKPSELPTFCDVFEGGDPENHGASFPGEFHQDHRCGQPQHFAAIGRDPGLGVWSSRATLIYK